MTWSFPDADTVYVVGAVFAAALMRSMLGFGEALVAVPLLAFRLPVTVAVPLSVLVSIVVSSLVIAQDWRHVQLRAAAGLLLPALLGIPPGLLLLTVVREDVAKGLLGAMVVAFAGYFLRVRNAPHLRNDHAGWMAACGFLSGVLGGAYGMNGPPLAVYGALRRWSPEHFRATLQGYFLPASIAALIGYISIGLWTDALLRYFLLSLPAVTLATLLGRAVNRRIDGGRFLRLVYLGLLITGLALVVQSNALRE